tara:strand:- start:364 stop:1428 length:1065 start_codon:yes stop_codon:yes gene_type:complete
MKKYRVAIVGLGRIGSTLDMSVANACKNSERLDVVAGSDILSDRRKNFESTWGIKSTYENYQEMIDRENPDIVAVCTTATGLPKPGNKAPNREFKDDSHAEITIFAANAGVPMLYVEKAIACSPTNLDKILESCKNNKTIVNTGTLMRFDQRFNLVKEAIEKGEIGQPTHAVAYTRSNTLMHMHIHSMDTLSYLLGDPGIISVRGELLPRNVTVSDNRLDEDPKSSYHIRFANEVEAWSIPAGPRDFEIIGTEGTIRAMNQGTGAIYRKSDTYDVTGTGWFETRLPDYPQQEPTLTCMEDLVESYETGKTPISGKIDVIHNLTEACLAVAESHRNGGSWIDLPMSNRELYVFHV